MGVDDGRGARPAGGGEHALRCAGDEVTAEDQVGATGRDADGGDVLGPAGKLEMGDDGAVLLRQAGHVDDAGALALEMGGHAEDMAGGDDAGAADAGHQDRPGPVERGQLGLGENREDGGLAGQLGGLQTLDQLAAFDRHEARAEALEAGIVLVAHRLVDLALAAEGVSTGWMATQFDLTPQSPQPSQTSSLMKTRRFGSGYSPRLRRRRFSAAQV